ncbi:MAG: tRNA 4-thiouridine(8) synthase ThiI [Clostridiales Family XIII bacterium]|jgi:thiamine biosynthesis protein ThiI|nr:tRNA 4-thiouridine(8) synthase ThiI [Clostridiales Family XIII bacterium]
MDNRNIFIVRCGEVALKGLNKPYFERMLAERVKKLLRGYGNTDVRREDGLIFVRAERGYTREEIIAVITKVFGVASVSPAEETASELDAIGAAAVDFLRARAERDGIKTFKVEAKRADKRFPVKSPEIASRVGAYVLKVCDNLHVDVHKPDCRLFVDVRKDCTYLYDRKIPGFGGLPLGTNGKGLSLLSGGIDSPVATFMMARRGMRVDAVHFHSFPYTSERAREKAETLAGMLAVYCGRFDMHVINMLPIQEVIAERCPEEEMTILLRRFMMRISERVAVETACGALITGENLGQVASQTAEALSVTDAATGLPVMRPLIAFDKIEIIEKAKEIGTYETSILPYEDCCTVFLPKHPVTKPKLKNILRSEEKLDTEALTVAAADSRETVVIYPSVDM